MLRVLYSFIFLLGSISFLMSQSSIIGVWKNLDDEDGKEKSHIQIYEENGQLKGKVIKLLPAATLKVCEKCTGSNKNKSIEGMEILWGLKKETNQKYGDGEILNPKNGKIYSCFIDLVESNKLKVHGYLGLSFIGKSQYWFRVK